MLTASVLLLVVTLLGAFDVFWFHERTANLTRRPECRKEAWIHVARGLVYAAQLALIPNVRFAGAWALALLALYVVDVVIAIADVAEEPRSRGPQGGLPRGEYVMHIVLSVLVGAMIHAVLRNAWAWAQEPTSVFVEPHAPTWLRALLGMLGAGVLGKALLEAAILLTQGKPKPVHVRVRLRAPLATVWDTTQDHVLHPEWDHRFSRIEMLSPVVREGTTMKYEKRIGGMTIRGFGRYKHHRPMKQSTFEFWSDDPRSLIRRGVGLWLYRDLGDGTVEFATSYTYEVRWGLFGALLDRFAFRPAFQWYTEQSFRRLARRFFPRAASPVLGAGEGRKPARFDRARIQRHVAEAHAT